MVMHMSSRQSADIRDRYFNAWDVSTLVYITYIRYNVVSIVRSVSSIIKVAFISHSRITQLRESSQLSAMTSSVYKKWQADRMNKVFSHSVLETCNDVHLMSLKYKMRNIALAGQSMYIHSHYSVFYHEIRLF